MRLVLFILLVFSVGLLQGQNTGINPKLIKKAPGSGYVLISKSDSTYSDSLMKFEDVVYDSTFFPKDSSNVYPGQSVLTPSGRVFRINNDSTVVYNKLFEQGKNPNQVYCLLEFGQSLTEGVVSNGSATTYEKGPLNRAKIFSPTNGGFVNLDIGSNNQDFFANNPYQHGEELSLAVEFENRFPNDTLYIIKTTVGASPSTNWHPYSWNMRMAIDGLWRTGLNSLRQMDKEPIFIVNKSLFTDGDAQATIDSFDIWFPSLIREFGPNVPVVLSTHPLGDLSFPINQGIRELCARHKNLFLHDLTGISTVDGTHPNYQGYKDWAPKFWDLVENWGLWGYPITKQTPQSYDNIDYTFEKYDEGETPREAFYAATGDFEIVTHDGSKQLHANNVGIGYSKYNFGDDFAMIGLQEMPYSTRGSDSISIIFDVTMTAECNFGITLDTRYERRNSANPPERVSGLNVWLRYNGNTIRWENTATKASHGTTSYTMPLNTKKRFRVKYDNPQLQIFEIDLVNGLESLLFTDSHYATGNHKRGRVHFLTDATTVYFDNMEIYFGTKTGIYKEENVGGAGSYELQPSGVIAGDYGSETEYFKATIDEDGRVLSGTNMPLVDQDKENEGKLIVEPVPFFSNAFQIASNTENSEPVKFISGAKISLGFNQSTNTASIGTTGVMGGSGSTNTLPKFTGSETLSDSKISEEVDTVTINAVLDVPGNNNEIRARIGKTTLRDETYGGTVGWPIGTGYKGMRGTRLPGNQELLEFHPSGAYGSGSFRLYSGGANDGAYYFVSSGVPTLNPFAGLSYVDNVGRTNTFFNGAWQQGAFLSDITGGIDKTLFTDAQTFSAGALSHTLAAGIWGIFDGVNEWIKFDAGTDIFSTKKHFHQGGGYSHHQTNNSTSGSTVLITNNGVNTIAIQPTLIDGERLTYINGKTNGLKFDVNTTSPTTIMGGTTYPCEAQTSTSFEYDVTTDNWYMVCETGVSGGGASNEINLPIAGDQSYTKTVPYFMADTSLTAGSYKVEAYIYYSSGATYSGDTTIVDFTGSHHLHRGEFQMDSWQFNPPVEYQVIEDISSLPYNYSTGGGGAGTNLMVRYIEFILNVQTTGQLTIKMGAENFTHYVKENSFVFIKKRE